MVDSAHRELLASLGEALHARADHCDFVTELHQRGLSLYDAVLAMVTAADLAREHEQRALARLVEIAERAAAGPATILQFRPRQEGRSKTSRV